MKKITPSKKEKLLKQADTVVGKMQELIWRCKEAGIELGTLGQSAGRSLRDIIERIEKS